MNKTIYILSFTALLVLGFLTIKFYTDNMYGEPNLTNGKEKYTNNCAVCHGERGHGDGVVAATLKVSPDNIYQEITNPFGFSYELINSVLDGDNGQEGLMPAFKGVLSKKDVNDIFGHIKSVN
ncbi:cytochrome c [Vibrio sp. ZSDE26]|uniref:Cytochrome c n=1 Tax=Vibrio amylolyticus TaxID=2847292 RepID=A0A9X2BKK7_9VIBR|nr:cytochrome c [Vibrio amylolyticus]MCK6264652.1 cytochrome c [Vibrio amylolyticus]